MTEVLFIVSHPLDSTKSWSRKIGEKLLASYREKNPSHKVTTIDVYKEEFTPLYEKDLTDMMTGSPTKMLPWAKQFAAADKYIFVAPLWNFSVPSQMKCYIDYIMQPGIAFRYTEQGVVGLLKEKKAIFVGSRGGFYKGQPIESMEMAESYIRNVMKFVGVTDFSSVIFEGASALRGADLEKASEKILQEAAALGAQF